jgi:hypothetical protein
LESYPSEQKELGNEYSRSKAPASIFFERSMASLGFPSSELMAMVLGVLPRPSHHTKHQIGPITGQCHVQASTDLLRPGKGFDILGKPALFSREEDWRQRAPTNRTLFKIAARDFRLLEKQQVDGLQNVLRECFPESMADM